MAVDEAGHGWAVSIAMATFGRANELAVDRLIGEEWRRDGDVRYLSRQRKVNL